jgi:hypothetical protein
VPLLRIPWSRRGGRRNIRKLDPAPQRGFATVTYNLVLQIETENFKTEPVRRELDMSELDSTKSSSQGLVPQQDSKRSAYRNVMLMYLISGAAGLVFWIGFTLDDLGRLQPAVEFLFGGFAGHILVWLYILSIIFIIMIAVGECGSLDPRNQILVFVASRLTRCITANCHRRVCCCFQRRLRRAWNVSGWRRAGDLCYLSFPDWS